MENNKIFSMILIGLLMISMFVISSCENGEKVVLNYNDSYEQERTPAKRNTPVEIDASAEENTSAEEENSFTKDEKDDEYYSNAFYKDSKGIIHCENANIGDKGVVDGVEYLAVDKFDLKILVHDYKNQNLTIVCTSKITDMSYLFYDVDSFDQPIGNWDVSNVQNMSLMFYKANSFSADISNWNVSSVKDMSHMFKHTNSFSGDISNWDVS
jgi:surface protein